MPKLNLTQFADGFEEYHERNRRPPPGGLRRRGTAHRSHHAILDEIRRHSDADPIGVQTTFNPTYTGSAYEREWILNYLGDFYDEGLITDVLHLVKGGKEATVYCCAGHTDTGLALIAAKVYRPRIFRNLRNDARYRQGRGVLDDDGKPVLNDRMLHAVAKKSSFGRELAHVSWLGHEYQTLHLLYEAGVSVPRPLALGNSTILMDYIGDEDSPAPILNQVRLADGEARPLFDHLLADVERMLACGRVHGDLSAYNVLYWNGEVKIIDFPQVVNPFANRDGFDILRRDVIRLCQYFARYGVDSDPAGIAGALWRRYGPPAPEPMPELWEGEAAAEG